MKQYFSTRAKVASELIRANVGLPASQIQGTYDRSGVGCTVAPLKARTSRCQTPGSSADRRFALLRGLPDSGVWFGHWNCDNWTSEEFTHKPPRQASR